MTLTKQSGKKMETMQGKETKKKNPPIIVYISQEQDALKKEHLENKMEPLIIKNESRNEKINRTA